MSIQAILRTTLIALIVIALPVIAGCAGLSSAQLEERDYRRTEFRNQFVEYRQRCYLRGGKIFIEAKQGLGRDDLPQRGDRYFCR